MSVTLLVSYSSHVASIRISLACCLPVWCTRKIKALVLLREDPPLASGTFHSPHPPWEAFAPKASLLLSQQDQEHWASRLPREGEGTP